MSACIPNWSYIEESHFDFGTFVDNLLKFCPVTPQANQWCELNETLRTYDSIVALLIVSLFVTLESIMHPQESKMCKYFGSPGARKRAEWKKYNHHTIVHQLDN